MTGHWLHERGGWVSFTKLDLHAMYGEFIGTVLFLLIGMAGVQATVTNLSMDNSSDGTSIQGTDAARLMGLFYISTSFGISLFATASIFYRFAGIGRHNKVYKEHSLINDLPLPLVRYESRFSTRMSASPYASLVLSLPPALSSAQSLRFAILDGLTPGKLSVSCQLGFGTNPTQGLFIEMFCTAALVLSVLMLAAEKSKLTPIAPLGFGFMLWAVELFSVEYTGGSINTARAFGPAVISGFTNYHWIYWVGPTLGSMLATAFYMLLKFIKYWEINPDQLSEDPKHAPTLAAPSQSQSHHSDSHSMA